MGCCGGLRPNNAVPAGESNLTGNLCCPIYCAQPETVGDVQETVPEFNLLVQDGQLVQATLTGYVTRTDANNSGTDTGFVHVRCTARRNDADGSFPGLAILFQSDSLQESSVGLGSLPAGVAVQFIVSGNVLQVELDGAAGTWFWDLQLNVCTRDVVVDVVVA